MGAHAYVTTNALAGLTASAYTWSNSYAGSDRALLNDGRLDKRVVVGSPSSSISVVIDLGSAQTLGGFALLNHNLVTSGVGIVTCRIRGADNGAISSNVVVAKTYSTLASYLSANARDPRNKDHVFAFTPVQRRYWQIELAWTGTISDLAFGEIFAWTGSPTSLARRSVYGSAEQNELLVTSQRTLSGDTRSSFLAGPVRAKRLSWADFNATELDELRLAAYRAGGPVTPMLWVESLQADALAAASADQECLLARLELGGFDFSQPDFNLYTPPEFLLRSLGREVGA